MIYCNMHIKLKIYKQYTLKFKKRNVKVTFKGDMYYCSSTTSTSVIAM